MAPPRQWHRFAPWAWGVLLAAIAYGPALWEWNASGFGDWQWFHHSWEVGRVAILRFGEWPLWDPNHCGGVSMWGQPQAQVYSPTWWASGLAFGTVHGHKIFILFHHAVGLAGMYVLARRIHRLGPPAAALAAIAWAFGGFFAWRGAGGHSAFLAFHYLPWIYLCWERAHQDIRYAAGVAALMGLVLFEGGIYPFPLTFLLLAFAALARLLERPRDIARVIRTALVSGVLTLAIGAARLWPIYRTMSRFPRATPMREDAQTLSNVIESLTAREPHAWNWGHRWVWPEYSAFVGWTVLALSLLGAFLALRRRRTLRWALGAIGFGACAMGAVEPNWPWPLIHELPVYDNLHVPSRFHVLLTFYMAALAGLALERMLAWLRRSAIAPGTQRAFVMLAWVLVAGTAIDVVSNDVRIAARWNGPPLELPMVPRFHLVGGGGYLESYAQYPSQHVGTAACYDPVPWPIAHGLWTGDVAQVRITPPSAGELVSFTRANHTFEAHVSLRAPARVIFNQNFDADWLFSIGDGVSDSGRLALDVPAGEHVLVASYQPHDLPWSVLATVLGLIAALLLSLRRQLARARSSLAERRQSR